MLALMACILITSSLMAMDGPREKAKESSFHLPEGKVNELYNEFQRVIPEEAERYEHFAKAKELANLWIRLGLKYSVGQGVPKTMRWHTSILRKRRSKKLINMCRLLAGLN